MDIRRCHVLRHGRGGVQLCADDDRFPDQSRQPRNGCDSAAACHHTCTDADTHADTHDHDGSGCAAVQRSDGGLANRNADADACGAVRHRDAHIDTYGDTCPCLGDADTCGAFADEHAQATGDGNQDADAKGDEY
jgi:hypothetical protein